MFFLQKSHPRSGNSSIFFLIICIALVVGYIFGRSVVVVSPESSFHQDTHQSESSSYPILSDPKTREVYALMKKYFFQFDQKTDTELKDAFLSALVESL